MFWGAISLYGPVALVRCSGSQNQHTHQQMLENNLEGFREKFVSEHGRDIIFQQDNASCHVSKKMQEYFDREKMVLLIHPAKSPDLNPIEHVWAVMNRDVQKKAPMCEEELCTAVQDFRDFRTKGPGAAAYLQNLYNSIHDRIDAVMKNSGCRSGY